MHRSAHRDYRGANMPGSVGMTKPQMLLSLSAESLHAADRLSRAALIARLQSALDPATVLHRHEELMLYEYDASALDMAEPDVVVVPSSTEEVAAAVRVGAAAGWPIVARGAGTGLSGGSVAALGGLVVSLARLDQIL